MKDLKVQRLFPNSSGVPSSDEESTSRSVYYKQVVGYDIDGNVLYDTLQRPKTQNGRGWMISYSDKVCDLVKKVTAASTLRVFMYIGHHQSYGQDNHFGFRCSHKHIQEYLGLDKSTLWDALHYLKTHQIVNVSRIDGSYEFMVNPDYITCGADKQSRYREWYRRLGQDVPLDDKSHIYSQSLSRLSRASRTSRSSDICDI